MGFNAGNIFGSIFGTAFAGPGGKYAAISQGLAIGGGLVKGLDPDDKGVDDAIGEFLLAGSEIVLIVPGTPERAHAAVASAQAALDHLKTVVNNNFPIVNQ